MAANRKTYEIVVETEVDKATGEMRELGSVVRTTAGDFDNINSAIAGTEDALGKLDPVKDAKEFKTLSKELQDLRDRQQDVQIQSLRFTEALAEQPGIVGAVGGSIEGLRGAFKALAANPIIAVLAAITGAFFALRESLNRSEEGAAALNRIGAALTGIMDGLFKIVEPIALAFADLTEKLLTNEKVLNGLANAFAAVQGVIVPLATFIKDTLINNFQALIGVAGGLGKTLKGIFTLDLDVIKEGVNEASTAFTDGVEGIVDNARGLGNDLADEFSGGISERADTIKDSITKPYKEAATEIDEEEQKRLEEEQARLVAAQKILADAELALQDERQQELIRREQQYQENLKQLKEAGISDTTALEEKYRQDILAINEKYDTEEEQKRQAEREQELAKEQAEKEERLLEIENRREFEDLTFQEDLALLNEREQILLDNEELTEAERTRIQAQFGQQRLELQEQYDAKQKAIEEEKVIRQQEIDQALLGLASQFGATLQQLGEDNKGVAIAGLIVEQSVAIADIIAQTARANAKAVAANPVFAGQPFVAINTASAALSIASTIGAVAKGIQGINSANPQTASTGGAAGASTPRTANLPAAPSLPSINPPQIAGGGGEVDTGRQVAETIGEASRRPVRAFVVSEDVSTQQQLDRRVKGSASF